MLFELRDYQSRDVEQLRNAYRKGRRAPLYCLPTGGGKTVVFSHVVERAAARGKRVLILVHRQELLRQSSESLDNAGIRHGWIAAGHLETSDPVQIASVQTLVRRLEKRRYPADLIVVDEAHHAVAGSWSKVIAHYPNAKLLGVTATPERLDGKGLGIESGGPFDELVVGPSVRELIDQGYLSPPTVYAPPIRFDASALRKGGGDFTRRSAAAEVDKPTITGDAVEHYRELLSGAPAIAFCTTREHAEHVAEDFRRAGYQSASIDGTLDSTQRKQRITDLGNGRLNVLSSCEIISEGTDIPVVAGALLLRPTASKSLYLQQVGRSLRISPGKERAVILDHVGNWERHGLPDDERQWSLAGAVRRGSRAAREVDEVPCVQCSKCYCTHRPAPKCPECGHVHAVRDRTPKQVNGKLREVDAEAKALAIAKRKEVGQAKTLDALRELAAARGYKPGWADHIWAARGNRRRGA